MNKEQFISLLRKHLQENNISDIEEILEEYVSHFDFKMKDGYSEEEISLKLGKPEILASQYNEGNNYIKKNKKVPIVIGLVTLDIFVYMFFITFAAWVIVLLAFSAASMGIGFSLFTGLNIYNLIPNLPYWCGAILAISFISLAVLSIAATYYSYKYLIQMHKAYIRTHKNTMNSANNKPQLPALPMFPQLSRKTSRKLRSVFLLSLTSFAISFVLGYVACAIAANSLEFWHVFGWFQ